MLNPSLGIGLVTCGAEHDPVLWSVQQYATSSSGVEYLYDRGRGRQLSSASAVKEPLSINPWFQRSTQLRDIINCCHAQRLVVIDTEVVQPEH